MTTIGELQKVEPHWVWANCLCGRNRPLTLAHLVIRFGPDMNARRIFSRMRCIACGRRGIQIQHVSWGNAAIGWRPFPTEGYDTEPQ